LNAKELILKLVLILIRGRNLHHDCEKENKFQIIDACLKKNLNLVRDLIFYGEIDEVLY